MAIAAVVITKNEEAHIADCLGTLGWVDEVIVVDAESTDRTVDIARGTAARVFVRPWPGYGPQKNFGIAHAQAEWILIVDADERVSKALQDEILAIVRTGSDSQAAGFEIPRRNYFYGKWIKGGGLYPDYQLRLFQKSAGRYDDVLLHENLRLTGSIRRLTEPLDHYSMPTIAHHMRKMRHYTSLGAREKLKRIQQVGSWTIATHHLGTILKTLLVRRGYRDGLHGIIVAMFAGLHTFVKYAKAWELLNVRADHPVDGHDPKRAVSTPIGRAE